LENFLFISKEKNELDLINNKIKRASENSKTLYIEICNFIL